ncbi:YigZ family protein [Anaerorhabdus sp.]|jgi:uncharacterized YigZ family protein|uniref:YigZ family protein n=1 Tax=Anaerorhabdus sp. TaxID=1872524 RepID=UPI002FC6A8BB
MRLKDEFSHSLIIEKSEFICYLKKTFTEEEARDYIEQIKKLHRDATHCCTAFVCGERSEIQRTNDDGEPSGTAGMPMLDALKKNELHNCTACVVRYFGGIKLGAGGLIRAYSKSVSEAIRLAPKVKTILIRRYSITFSYDLVGKIDFFLKDNSDILNKDFDLDVTYVVQSEDFKLPEKLINITSGQIECIQIEECYIEKELTNTQ